MQRRNMETLSPLRSKQGMFPVLLLSPVKIYVE